METFYHTGAIISGFLGVLMLFNRNKHLQNWILSLWLIIMGINIFIHHWVSDHNSSATILRTLNTWLLFIQVPMPFLFVTSISGRLNLKKAEAWLHFVPAVVFIPLLYIAPSQNISIIVKVYPGAGIPVYLFRSIIEIKNIKTRDRNKSSDTKDDLYSWLIRFIAGISAGWFIYFLLSVMQRFIEWLPPEAPLNYSIMVLTGSIIYLGIFGLQRTALFVSPPEVKEPSEVCKTQTEELKKILSAIETSMEEHQYYLRPRLSIKELSLLTGFSVNLISQAINSVKNQNFYEFINSYRINVFIEKLSDPLYKDYTYEAIAYECGFNSKSTFYDLFKKYTGYTPGQFIKIQKNKRE